MLGIGDTKCGIYKPYWAVHIGVAGISCIIDSIFPYIIMYARLRVERLCH